MDHEQSSLTRDDQQITSDGKILDQAQFQDMDHTR